jgi:hypothetical protein
MLTSRVPLLHGVQKVLSYSHQREPNPRHHTKNVNVVGGALSPFDRNIVSPSITCKTRYRSLIRFIDLTSPTMVIGNKIKRIESMAF